MSIQAIETRIENHLESTLWAIEDGQIPVIIAKIHIGRMRPAFLLNSPLTMLTLSEI